MALRTLFSTLFFILITASSCDKELEELRMVKTPYNGNELRTDGYYYSEDIETSDFGLAVFYKDGVCYHLFGSTDFRPIDDYIEQEILLNDLFIDRLRTTPTNIGVFNVEGQSVFIEHWEASRNILALKRLGEIINDSTFIMREIETLQGEIENTNYVYRFKEFSPKPDSTSMFIK